MNTRWTDQENSYGARVMFEMEYACPCGEEWYMQYECACNDRCPSCRTENEPISVEDVND